MQEIIPGCMAVLNIDAARAKHLHYTPGQQVRVKQVNQDLILVDLGFGPAFVNAWDVSITQAGTQPVSTVGWARAGGGGPSKSATFVFEPPVSRCMGDIRRISGATSPLSTWGKLQDRI